MNLKLQTLGRLLYAATCILLAVVLLAVVYLWHDLCDWWRKPKTKS